VADGHRADVLVVGAGPTGLTLAGVLASSGVDVRVVDGASGPQRESSRATTVHAATLELLDRFDGLGREIASRAARAARSTIWSGRRRVAQVRWDRMPTPYAGMFNIPQAETEALLRERLEGLRCDISWRTTAHALERDRSGTCLRVERGGREEALTARWIVGCDGAHSRVRRSLGVRLEGSTHEERFLLGDVRLDTDLRRDQTHLFVSTRGVLGIMPLADGRFRLNGTLTRDEDLTAGTLAELIAHRLSGRQGVELLGVDWLADYRTHSRLADRFRVGNVFLAGDAAHLNSPVGGQGMNVGVHDAVNLGWKLSRVLRGKAPPQLLETYATERRAAAAEVIRASERGTRMVAVRAPLARALRNAIMRFAHRLPPVQGKLALEPAGLTQRVRHGAVVDQIGRRRRAGQKLPSLALPGMRPPWLHHHLHGFEHDLLLLNGAGSLREVESLARSFGIRVHRVGKGHEGNEITDPEGRVAAAFGVEPDRDAAVLVRPDSVVAWIGASEDTASLGQYVRSVIG
jgi:2-polyprenyl-6-methoxyphenol hydroxylase-like FAD-dependent oxidoreductase